MNQIQNLPVLNLILTHSYHQINQLDLIISTNLTQPTLINQHPHLCAQTEFNLFQPIILPHKLLLLMLVSLRVLLLFLNFIVFQHHR